jgi:LysM repeat protein
MENPDQENGSQPQRCPNCDSVVPTDAHQCLMCGYEIDQPTVTTTPASEEGLLAAEEIQIEPTSRDEEFIEIDSQPLPIIDSRVIRSEMKERLSPVTFLLTVLFAIIVVSLGILVLMFPADAAVEFIPTATPIPDVVVVSESSTIESTETSEPTSAPTLAASPIPTDTPQPPRAHTVSTGETLFGLGLRYSVSIESVATLNNIPSDSALQISQELLIPWPTATPPLVPVEVEINGERIIADPADCQTYEIKGGDTLFGIAASFNVPTEAMLAVNRLSELSILQPGDTICIPQIVFGAAIPSTPGPSPTPGPTLPPSGPELLYPVEGSLNDSSVGKVALQWVAVKHLADDEWYMIELTDLTEVDSHPRRAFTRQTSFQLPDGWTPQDDADHDIRWRVSIVRITGQREDGSFIYTFGGETSDDSYFEWRAG